MPRIALVAFGLSVLQALSGALLVWTLLGLFSTLLHAGIMALLFGSYAVLVRGVLVRPRATVRIVPTARPHAAALT
jgi:heme A synthase